MRFWLIFLLVLFFDRLSKLWIQHEYVLGENRPLISDWFSLTYVQNRGAAFGILEGQKLFFLIIAILVLIIIIWFNFKYKPEIFIQISLGLIAGGAGGNLIDRFIYNAVIDFISIGWWPVFNIADIGIVTGSIFLIVHLLLHPEKEN